MEPDIGILKTNLLKAYQTKPEVFVVEEFLEQFVNESFIHLKQIIDIGDEYGNRIINMNSFWKRMCIKRYRLVKNNILMYSKDFLHGNIDSHNVIITKPWYEIYCLLFHEKSKFNLKELKYQPRNILNNLFRETKIYKEIFMNTNEIRSFILDIFGNLFINRGKHDEFLSKNVRNIFLRITSFTVNNEPYFILFISFIDNTSAIYTTISEDLHVNNDIEFPSKIIPLKFYVTNMKVSPFFSIFLFTQKTENNNLIDDEIIVKIDMFHHTTLGDIERFFKELILDNDDNNPDVLQHINNISLFSNFTTISELMMKFNNDLILRKEYKLEKQIENSDGYSGLRNNQHTYTKQFKLPSLLNKNNYNETNFLNLLNIEDERIVDIKLKSAYELNDKKYYKLEMFLDHIVLLTTSTNRIFLLNLNFIYSSPDELILDGTDDRINDLQSMLNNAQYILLENVVKIKFEVIDNNKIYSIYILDNEDNLYYYGESIGGMETSGKLHNFTSDEVSDIISKIQHYKEKFLLIGLQVANFESNNYDVYVERKLL